jgi:hypothetical protein
MFGSGCIAGFFPSVLSKHIFRKVRCQAVLRALSSPANSTRHLRGTLTELRGMAALVSTPVEVVTYSSTT